MIIRKVKKSDVATINKWLASRKHKAIRFKELPSMSFIIPGVAACGIRRCEGSVGIMDSLVTNPHVSGLTRNVALNQLFKVVLSMPSFTRIIGFTVDNNTLERAVSHGFKQIHYSLLAYSKD